MSSLVSTLRAVYDRIVRWHFWIERQEGFIALLVGAATLCIGVSELVVGWPSLHYPSFDELCGILGSKGFWFNMAHLASGLYFVLFACRLLLKRFDPIVNVHRLLSRDRDGFYQELQTTDKWDGFSSVSCVQSDIPVLAALGKEAFTEVMIKLAERTTMFREWLSANADSFALIKHGDRPAGYVCVLPLKTNTAHKHMQGVQSQFKFSKEDIDGEHSKYVYVNAVYLRSEYRSSKAAVLTTINAVVDRVAKFAPTKIHELTLYAEAFTPQGIDLLGGLGFHPAGTQSLDSKSIYVLEFRQPTKLSLVARSTIGLVKRRVEKLRQSDSSKASTA